MTRIVQLLRHGGPEVLGVADVALTPPASGELRVRHTAIGVNYHDVYVRSGLQRTLPLPGVPGIEAAGVVEGVGPEVSGWQVGDRLAYVASGYGCYAEARNLDAELAVRLPTGLSDAEAAASFMKALTVEVLVHRVRRIRAGETVLVHAAAGGAGQLLCSWAAHLGATVVATVGSDEKAAIARDHGAAHVILYRDESVPDRVGELTGGEGVAAVYDSVGADTFAGSVASLAYEGHLVSFGQASGPIEPFTPALLASKSLTVSRPVVFHYLRSRGRLEAMSATVFAAFDAGIIRPIDPIRLPLHDAPEAHRLLEARRSPGGIVLEP